MTAAPFRVVRIYFRLPPEPGGMEEHIARLSAAQREQGVDVVNVFNVGQADGQSLRLFAGRDLLGIRPAILRNALFYGGALVRSGRLAGKLPTMLHVHGDWSDFLFGRLLGRAIGAAGLTASIHSTLLASRRNLYVSALKSYGSIFSTGKAEQLTLETLLGREVRHLPSAPSDVFLAARPAPPQRYDVISVGNLFDVKAPGLILDCASRRPDLRFGLIGDGPLGPVLRERVAREGLSNVDMLGRLDRSDIAAVLQKSRLFLSTSLREGTPTVALEAMAVGLPLLLTPSNDYSWLVEKDVNGRVTGGWDVGEIVADIDHLLRDEDRRQAMGAQNRVRASAHSWRANARHVSDIMAAQLGLSQWQA